MANKWLNCGLIRMAGMAFVLPVLSGCVQSKPKIGIKSGETPRVSANLAVPGPIDNGATSGAESFSASAYGVSASPIVARGSRLPRGGGYAKLGRSYIVKGKRYYPTRTPKPVQFGRASWYGSAFHGRKTANGEVYDMNHLTAAHKTMPLPSYARVTNVKNGRSVIVRVNDRGPFSNNRLIDLSKRAAEILDYTLAGTAKVKVEYVGPAPLDGQDDDYLLASVRGYKSEVAPQRLPGVDTDLVSTNVAPPGQVLAAAYTDWRVSSAFDIYKTERNTLLWKRMNPEN